MRTTHTAHTHQQPVLDAPHATAYRALVDLVSLFCALFVVVFVTMGLRSDLFFALDNFDAIFKALFVVVFAGGAGLAWWRHTQLGRSAEQPLMFVLLMFGWLLIMAVHSFYTTDSANLQAILFASGGPRAAITIFCLGAAATLGLMRISCPVTAGGTGTQAYVSAFFGIGMATYAYALHCPHDEPLYVAVWYGSAVAAFMGLVAPLLAARCRRMHGG